MWGVGGKTSATARVRGCVEVDEGLKLLLGQCKSNLFIESLELPLGIEDGDLVPPCCTVKNELLYPCREARVFVQISVCEYFSEESAPGSEELRCQNYLIDLEPVQSRDMEVFLRDVALGREVVLEVDYRGSVVF